MKQLLILALLIFGTVIMSVHASPDAETWTVCNLTITWDWQLEGEARLTIADVNGNPVFAYNSGNRPNFLPSPDCSYIAATLRTFYGHESEIIIWDGSSAQVVARSTPSYGYEGTNYIIDWSPDSNRILLPTHSGVYLWDFLADTYSTIYPKNINSWYPSHQWDAARKQLLFIATLHNGLETSNLLVFDWMTGTQVAEYANLAGQDEITNFKISDDNRYIILYTVRATPGLAGVTIWDRDTGAYTMVDAGTDGSQDDDHIALSPDARYLVIGRHTIRVWDLQNLPEKLVDRDPTRYDVPKFITWKVHFFNNTIVELSNIQGKTIRMDITTGETLP